MDFKAQILEDLKVFHNPEEFGTVTNLWYNGGKYTLPIIIDHETVKNRTILMDDHAEGVNQVESTIYLSFEDLGFIPKKGMIIELEEAGVINLYEITKSVEEYGEIILELGAYSE